MSKSLLDLMPQADRERAIERGKKRLVRKEGATVSPEMYITAEFGYYFGWEGILAIKRGYIEKINSKGQIEKEPFTLDEVLVLLEAAKKVWWTKVIDQSHGTFVANASANQKNAGAAFNNGMKPFTDKVM